jgi:hypothetical protein
MEVEELLGTAKVRRKTVAKEVWARAGCTQSRKHLNLRLGGAIGNHGSEFRGRGVIGNRGSKR